jgi:hypothetical protein
VTFGRLGRVSNTSNLSTRARASLEFNAWVGDVAALGKVVDVCRDLAAEATRIAQLEVATVGGMDRDAFESIWGHETPGESRDRWESRLSEEREELAQGLGLRMAGTQNRFKQEFVGEPEDVLAALNVSDVKSLSLKMGNQYTSYKSGGFGLDVNFDREAGCEVKLTAPDQNWLVLANERLRVVLKDQRPWYWFLRSLWVSVPLAFMPLFVVLVSVTLSLPADAPAGEVSVAGVVAVFGLMATFYAAFGLAVVIRSKLPAFELVPVGKSARGGRAVSVSVAMLAWLGGILIPIFITRGQ